MNRFLAAILLIAPLAAFAQLTTIPADGRCGANRNFEAPMRLAMCSESAVGGVYSGAILGANVRAITTDGVVTYTDGSGVVRTLRLAVSGRSGQVEWDDLDSGVRNRINDKAEAGGFSFDTDTSLFTACPGSGDCSDTTIPVACPAAPIGTRHDGYALKWVGGRCMWDIDQSGGTGGITASDARAQATAAIAAGAGLNATPSGSGATLTETLDWTGAVVGAGLEGTGLPGVPLRVRQSVLDSITAAGTANELRPYGAPPAITADTPEGLIANVRGNFLVTVDDSTDSNTLRGTAGQETIYRGVSVIDGQPARGSWTDPSYRGEFEWVPPSVTGVALQRMRLPTAILGTNPPAQVWIVFVGQRGETFDGLLSRDSARDITGFVAYASATTGPTSDTPVGDTFAVSLYSVNAGPPPSRGSEIVTVHITDRWEDLLDRRPKHVLTVLDEGTRQGTAGGVSTVNIRGAGASVTVSGSTAIVEVPGTVRTSGAIDGDGQNQPLALTNDSVGPEHLKAVTPEDRTLLRERIDAAPGPATLLGHSSPDLAHERHMVTIERIDAHAASLVWDQAEGCFEAANVASTGTYRAEIEYCPTGRTGTGTDRGRISFVTATAPASLRPATFIPECTITGIVLTVGAVTSEATVALDTNFSTFALLSAALPANPAWSAGTDTQSGTYNFRCSTGLLAWRGAEDWEVLSRAEARAWLGVDTENPDPTAGVADFALTANATTQVPPIKIVAPPSRDTLATDCRNEERVYLRGTWGSQPVFDVTPATFAESEIDGRGYGSRGYWRRGGYPIGRLLPDVSDLVLLSDTTAAFLTGTQTALTAVHFGATTISMTRGATNVQLGDPGEPLPMVDLYTLNSSAPAGDWDQVRFEGPSGTFYPAAVSYPSGGYECANGDWAPTDIDRLGLARPNKDFSIEVWQDGQRRKFGAAEFAGAGSGAVSVASVPAHPADGDEIELTVSDTIAGFGVITPGSSGNSVGWGASLGSITPDPAPQSITSIIYYTAAAPSAQRLRIEVAKDSRDTRTLQYLYVSEVDTPDEYDRYSLDSAGRTAVFTSARLAVGRLARVRVQFTDGTQAWPDRVLAIGRYTYSALRGWQPSGSLSAAQATALILPEARVGNEDSWDITKLCAGGVIAEAAYAALPSRSADKLYCTRP